MVLDGDNLIGIFNTTNLAVLVFDLVVGQPLASALRTNIHHQQRYCCTSDDAHENGERYHTIAHALGMQVFALNIRNEVNLYHASFLRFARPTAVANSGATLANCSWLV